MTYFSKVKTLEEAKKLYKELALKNHPDMGGSVEVMQEINSEFQLACSLLSENATTARVYYDSTVSEFYTQNGWKGINFKWGRSTKEIAQLVREYVKAKYPRFRFSIQTSYASMCSEIHIKLTEGYTDAFLSEKEFKEGFYREYRTRWSSSFRSEEELIEHINNIWERRYRNEIVVSRSCADDDFYGLAPEVMNMLADVCSYVQSYRYSDCDGMIDYFDTNFYFFGITIGRYEKPYTINEKLASKKSRFMQVA